MASRSVILQKKLYELESEVADIIRLPLDPASSSPRLKMPFVDIKKRFVFLNNLLMQEIASQPQNSDQLYEIGERLTALESVFRKWNEWRLSVCSDCTRAILLQGDTPVSGSPVSATDDFSGEKSLEKVLRYFETEESSMKEGCTEVVPYDDLRDSVSESDSTSDLEDFFDEETPENFFDSLEKDGNAGKDDKPMAAPAGSAEEENVWSKIGKFGGAFGCGMIVGAICMVKLFFISSSSHQLIEFEALILPPT